MGCSDPRATEGHSVTSPPSSCNVWNKGSHIAKAGLSVTLQPGTEALHSYTVH